MENGERYDPKIHSCCLRQPAQAPCRMHVSSNNNWINIADILEDALSLGWDVMACWEKKTEGAIALSCSWSKVSLWAQGPSVGMLLPIMFLSPTRYAAFPRFSLFPPQGLITDIWQTTDQVSQLHLPPRSPTPRTGGCSSVKGQSTSPSHARCFYPPG